MLVKMATMDRDDKGDKRIPILMNYLSASRPALVLFLPAQPH